jgi:vibriolysin
MTIRYSKRCLGLAIMMGLGAVSANAASMLELSIDKLPYNMAGQSDMRSAIAAPGSTNAIAAMLGTNETFQMDNDMALANGEVRERGYQMYRGMKVFGADYIGVRNAAGEYTFVNGSMLRNIARDVGALAPRMSAAQAEGIAKSSAQGLVAAGKIENLKPTELMIVQRADGKAVMAYRTEYLVSSPTAVSAPVQFIDAMTGEVVFQYNNLQTVEARGTGPGGNGRTGQYEHGATARGLSIATRINKTGTTCQLSNSRTIVVNARNGQGTGTTPIAYTCADANNRFVEGTFNGAFGVANDINAFGQNVFEFYISRFNTQPLRCGNILVQYAHVMQRYDNAFYTNCQMRYGDGNSFYPLVSTDVVAHEISHGVTEGRSNLVYANQPGGLNESFSDMAGAAFTFFLTGSTDYLVGSQISKNGQPLRYMNTPSRDGRSINTVAQFTQGLDPHFGSGPTNRFFFLLSTTPGWDPLQAFDIVYRANNMYWTTNTSYQQAGTGLCRAAADLNRDGNAVRTALNAVGINPTNCTGNGQPQPGGNVLQNGVPRTGISVGLNQQVRYSIAVPGTARTITFRTTGGNGDVDLYARFNALPSTTTFTCRSEGANSNETCTAAVTGAGTFNILLNGFAAATGVTLTATFQ